MNILFTTIIECAVIGNEILQNNLLGLKLIFFLVKQ